MPDVICNTSPIQYLHQADVLELLPTLVGQVCIPETVVADVCLRSVPICSEVLFSRSSGS